MTMTIQREDAYLAGDVAPVVLAAQVLNVLAEKGAHLNDSIGHALDLTKPLLLQRRVVEDGRGDPGTMDGRVGVQRANDDFDLRVNAGLFLCRLADDGKGTGTLTIETLHQVSTLP